MKRSEMLKKLEESIWFDIKWMNDARRSDSRRIADTVLEMVEECGMVYCIRGFKKGIGKTIYIKGWEPENEKK